jgi:hypothetical protein
MSLRQKKSRNLVILLRMAEIGKKGGLHVDCRLRDTSDNDAMVDAALHPPLTPPHPLLLTTSNLSPVSSATDFSDEKARKYKHLSAARRAALLVEHERLLFRPQRCGVKDLCRRYGVSTTDVSKLKKKFDACDITGGDDFFHRKVGSGPPTIILVDVLLDMARTDFYDVTYEEAGDNLGVEASTVWRYLKREGRRKVQPIPHSGPYGRSQGMGDRATIQSLRKLDGY